MKRHTILMLALCVMLLAACKEGNTDMERNGVIDKSVKAAGDKMIYGLACDGCTDSTIVFLSNEGGDPVTYNIVRATHNKQIFGHPEIGDWVGIMLNPGNPKEAAMVIDLDQLKGTWTYQVMPVLKEMATKTEGEIKAELTDSVKALIFVPREYGFSLKRQFQASSVGFMPRNNVLEEESIVEYPPVKHYTGWHIYNGRLVLVGDTVNSRLVRLPDSKVRRDTAEFVYMSDDSLALRFGKEHIGYRRMKETRK